MFASFRDHLFEKKKYVTFVAKRGASQCDVNEQDHGWPTTNQKFIASIHAFYDSTHQIL